MKTIMILGSNLGYADPTHVCERVDLLGYIKFHDSEIYSEIPLKILRVRLLESTQYLVRNALRVEIACRQVESFRLTGNM